jgi:signal transduction histidine kinase
VIGLELQPFLVSNTPPTRRQTALAIAVAACLACGTLIAVPLAGIRLEGSEPVLPAYAGGLAVVEIMTGVLLLATLTVSRNRAVTVVAAGYVFSGLLAIPWAISFPGVFPALGLDVDVQSTATLAAVRRLGLALSLLAYAGLRLTDEPDFGPGQSRRSLLGCVFAVAAAALAVSLLALSGYGHLPRLMANTREVAPLWRYVPAAAMALYALTAAILLASRRSVLDLWLTVVVLTLAMELVLLSYVAGGTRLTIGWWTGRVLGLVSAGMVLTVLVSQTAILFARLADAAARDRQDREARLTIMEALSASIAHEINQPLSSMVTNAYAALRWLGKPEPHIPEAADALQDIVKDGHRAGRIVEETRGIFRKTGGERELLDLAAVLEEALDRLRFDVARSGMRFQVAPFERPVIVSGNRIQLEQVVCNLVTNALEALRGIVGRERRVTIRCRRDGNWAVVSIIDNGPGVAQPQASRIFDPFFSTKADGMGMGLMVCRTVVEAHGGQLWLEAADGGGAAFSFRLPALDQGMDAGGEE